MTEATKTQRAAWIGWALVPLVLLDGEHLFVLGSFLSKLNWLDYRAAVIATIVLSFVSDQAAFVLGRRHGRRWIESRTPRTIARIERVQRALHRFGAPFVLGARFCIGLREVAPFVIGTTAMSSARFALLNLAGSLLWGGVAGGAVQLATKPIAELARWVWS